MQRAELTSRQRKVWASLQSPVSVRAERREGLISVYLQLSRPIAPIAQQRRQQASQYNEESPWHRVPSIAMPGTRWLEDRRHLGDVTGI
jgi:hypothetical protein